MRQPLTIRNPGRGRVSEEKPLPPPIGGINARDSAASMPLTDAYELQNVYPSNTYMEFRGGCAEHITSDMGGVGLNLNTLAVYNAMDGASELWAFGNGTFDVSVPGAAGASVLSRTSSGSITNQWTMFGDGTTNWLIAVNGSNDPAYYDGSTWATKDETTSPALTGYTGNAVHQFIHVHVFKGRLFFIPIDSLSFWYLPAGVAGGALTEFSLAAEAPAGGYLMAMATWTRDGGSGPDDFAVFITSEGEVIIYQGNNPGSTTNWAKVGTFKTGKPLGRRCLTQYGADVLLLAEDGVFTLSSLLAAGEDRSKYALSYKIQPLFTQYAKDNFSLRGWRAIFYPAKEALLINVPLASESNVQLVMNTTTKAWTEFSGWYTMNDLAVYNRELYGARARRVYKLWAGTEDVTAGTAVNINYSATQSYNAFGSAATKHMKLIMPLLEVNEDSSVSLFVDTDFNTQSVGYSGGELPQTETVSRQWLSPAPWPGRWQALRLSVASDTLTGKWHGTVLVFERAR